MIGQWSPNSDTGFAIIAEIQSVKWENQKTIFLPVINGQQLNKKVPLSLCSELNTYISECIEVVISSGERYKVAASRCVLQKKEREARFSFFCLCNFNPKVFLTRWTSSRVINYGGVWLFNRERKGRMLWLRKWAKKVGEHLYSNTQVIVHLCATCAQCKES